MRRGAGILAAIVVAAALPIAAPPAIAAERCLQRSWIGGTTEWCNGALVYRDYIYDDTGADTVPGAGINNNALAGSPHGTRLTQATGDVDHRDHGAVLNSADLIELRLEHRAGRLHVVFELNTLMPNDKTLAALAIDTDNDRATGGGRWSDVVDVSSEGWDAVAVFDDRDPVHNRIAGTMPLPTKRRWRIQAVIALGDGTPMNVAFRGRQETGGWWEQKQSAALADGNVSPFGYVVDRVDLGTRNDPAALPGPGLFERIYTSDHPLGEGVDYEGKTFPGVRGTYTYLGRYEPYAIYVPRPGKRGDYGIQLALHGADAAHGSLVGGAGMQYAFGDYLRALGDKPRLVVVPLCRGPNCGYQDWSLYEVLAAVDDVKSHWPVDDDRVFAGGYSMGGGGTYRLTEFFPDLFAGAINWVGFLGDVFNGTPVAGGRQRPDPPIAGLWANDVTDGNLIDYLEGTRHVPMAMVYAAGDELVWVNHPTSLMRRYDELDYEHKLWLYPTAVHLTFAILDDWQLEAAWTANRTRIEDPARVSYRTNPAFWFDPAGIKPDGAYWVDDLVPANNAKTPKADILVELTSHRCEPRAEVTNDIDHGAGPAPLPWISQEGKPRRERPISQSNRISGVVVNVKSFTLDVARACMRRGPIDLDVRVDVPTKVSFSDGRPSVTLRP